MACKNQERNYVEWFLCDRAIAYQRLDEADPPDFYMTRDDDTRVALEVTNLYREPKPARKGSKAKKTESEHTRWLQKVADAYYRDNSVPLAVQINLFGSVVCEDATDSILDFLHSCIEMHVGECRGDKLDMPSGTLGLTVHRLPDSFGRDKNWCCPTDHTGYVGPVTEAHIENAVNAKEPKIAAYRACCDKVWLLLVLDRLWQSGMLQCTDSTPCIRKSGFDAIWLLEYPKAIHRLL